MNQRTNESLQIVDPKTNVESPLLVTEDDGIREGTTAASLG